MEQQTPIHPPNQGWSRAKGKNAPFSHTWFGEEGGLGFPFILSKIVACEQALYLGESQEVTQEQHAKRDSRLASLPIHGEPANRLCWSQLVSLATVFVSSRNAPPFAVCWGGALRDETKTVALNPGHMLGGERSHHCSTLDLMTDSSLP